jgi:hypothetical protein
VASGVPAASNQMRPTCSGLVWSGPAQLAAHMGTPSQHRRCQSWDPPKDGPLEFLSVSIRDRELLLPS